MENGISPVWLAINRISSPIADLIGARPGKLRHSVVYVCDCMKDAQDSGPDLELAVRMAKLWPHRKHEASISAGLLCRIGVHWWRALDLTALVPGRDIHHCFWCSKVRIDGNVYDVQIPIARSRRC